MSARMQVCPERIAAMIDGSRGWWCMGNDEKDASLTALLNELLVAAGEHAAAMHALGVATGAGLKRAYYQARDRVKIASEGFDDATVRLGERLRAEESRGVVPQPPGCDMRDDIQNQDGTVEGWRTANTAPVGVRGLTRQEQSIMHAALRRSVRIMCEECSIYPADPPSRFCLGCEAYQEHTR